LTNKILGLWADKLLIQALSYLLENH